MSGIAVANDSGVDVDLARLRGQARFMLGELGLHARCELAITLVGPAEMSELHEQWMDEPGPTDVLSFPMDELRIPEPGQPVRPGILGDVVICPQVAADQAAAAGHGLSDELTLLLTHGILHLLGFDHATDEEHADMFGRQGRLIAAWNASGARQRDPAAP